MKPPRTKDADLARSLELEHLRQENAELIAENTRLKELLIAACFPTEKREL